MAEVTHEQVPTNGIELHVAVAGPADGPPVVLCHGFPELWYSWRHQLGALADAGYRAYAPDLRGYGEQLAPDRGHRLRLGQADRRPLRPARPLRLRHGRLRRARLGRHGRVGDGTPAPRSRLVALQHERAVLERPRTADRRSSRCSSPTRSSTCSTSNRSGRPRPSSRPTPAASCAPCSTRPAREGMATRARSFATRPREGHPLHGHPDARTRRAPAAGSPRPTSTSTPPPSRRAASSGPCSFYRNMDANWERSHDIPASVYTMPTGFLTGALDPVAPMMPERGRGDGRRPARLPRHHRRRRAPPTGCSRRSRPRPTPRCWPSSPRV